MPVDVNVPRWPGLLKWFVVVLVLVAVGYTSCDGARCRCVAAATVEGMVWGAVFGLLAWVSRLAATPRPVVFLTPRRVWTEVRRETAAACVVGLLVGLTKAIIALGG